MIDHMTDFCMGEGGIFQNSLNHQGGTLSRRVSDGMKVDVDGMKLSTDHVIRRAAKHHILAGQVEGLKDMLVRSSA